MDGTPVGTLRRRSDLTPLVRASRSQFEVNYLPPYGDPEVNIPGEVATYALAGGLAAELVGYLEE